MRKPSSFFFVLCLLFSHSGHTQSMPKVPAFQQNMQSAFKAGINISFYENYWKPRSYLLGHPQELMQKLELAKQLGLTSVRLPVAFDLF